MSAVRDSCQHALKTQDIHQLQQQQQQQQKTSSMTTHDRVSRKIPVQQLLSVADHPESYHKHGILKIMAKDLSQTFVPFECGEAQEPQNITL